MELPPRLYHWFVRPNWLPKLYASFLNSIINEDKYDIYNKTVLDFGSGIGSSCPMFHPGNYLGIDCDSSRVRYARRLYPEYNFRILEGKRLPVSNNSIDYIFIISVLHHIPGEDLGGFLKEFRRVLRAQGKIFVFEPCFFDHSRFSNFFMRFFDKGKYIQYEDGYLKTFKTHGYNVESYAKYKQMYLYNKLFFKLSPT